MRGVVEFIAFTGLAGVLHLAGFALMPGDGGASVAGNGGEDRVTLSPASPQMAALIAEWQRPPEVSARIPQSSAKTLALTELQPPANTSAPDPAVAQVSMPQPLAPAAEALPRVPVLQPPVPEAQIRMPDPVARAAPENPAAPRMQANEDTGPKLSSPALSAPDARDAGLAAPESPDAPPPDAPKTKPRQRPDKPAKPPTAAPALKAKGKGNDSQSGQGGSAKAPAAKPGKGAEKALAGWQARIVSAIERRKRYPREAAGAVGKVTVEISLMRSGALASARIAAGSGNAALDAAALSAVTSARLPAAPTEVAGDRHSFRFRMVFSR